MSKLDAIENPCVKHANVVVAGIGCVSCMMERIAELEDKVKLLTGACLKTGEIRSKVAELEAENQTLKNTLSKQDRTFIGAAEYLRERQSVLINLARARELAVQLSYMLSEVTLENCITSARAELAKED